MDLELDNVDEDFQELLENDSIDQREPIQIVDIEAPAGFGRSEYRKMLDDLWSEGEKVRMTNFETGLDLVDESLDTIGYSVPRMLEGAIERDSEELGTGALGTLFGTVGFVGSPVFTAMSTGGDYLINRLEIGPHTYSDDIYQGEESDQRTARVFYTEGADGRYMTFAPANPGETLDTELVQEAVDYIEEFEV